MWMTNGNVSTLKRTLVRTEAGIVIEPNKQYIPELLELLKGENRGKSVPHHLWPVSWCCTRFISHERSTA